jgi:hypothetical protein
MGAAPSLHPTDQALRAHGVGKLDYRAAEAVFQHLVECTKCRQRVAEVPADGFLSRVRDAQKATEESSGPPPAKTLVPELVNDPGYDIESKRPVVVRVGWFNVRPRELRLRASRTVE